MKNTDEIENGFSLHLFRLYVEKQYNRFTDKDYVKKQKNILRAAGINQSLIAVIHSREEKSHHS